MSKPLFTLAAVGVAWGVSVSAETLEPVVVSGTRSAQSTVTVPAAITVITRSEIERSGAENLLEVLRGRGGIQISDLYGDGSRGSVDMRGFSTTGNVLVLVDGRSLNNADLGGPDLGSIALKDVQQVEIIQGSAGTLFGDQAVGGVINIITRAPRSADAHIEAGVGSYDAKLLRGTYSERLASGLAVRVSAERRESDNYRDHNAREYGNAFGRLDYDFAGGSVFAEWQHVEEDLELPGYLTDAEREADRTDALRRDFNDTARDASRIGTRLILTPNWQLEAELGYRDEEITGTLSGGAFAFEQDRRHLTLQPRLLGSLPVAHGDALVTLGIDVDDIDYRLTSPFGVTENDQRIEAVYAQAVTPLSERLTATFGARHARYDSEVTDSFSFPNGTDLDDTVTVAEAGLSFKATPEWRLFARRDGNFRFPLVDENTFTATGTFGLKTQTGVSWETGAEWQRDGHRFKALAYRLDLKNEITYNPNAGFWGANVNLDATRRQGFILEGRWQARRDLALTADYTYTDPEITGGAFDGNAIPFVARHVLRLAGDYRLSSHWNLFAEAVHTGERYPDADYDNTREKLPEITVANTAVGYRRGDWTAQLRVNNLLDKEYAGYAALGVAEVGYYPAPERNAVLTVGYAF